MKKIRVSLLVIFLIIAYFLFDIEFQKDSVKWPMPWPIPHARLLQLRNPIYEKDFTVGSYFPRPGITGGGLSITVPMHDKSFFEIYEDNKLIIRIEKLSKVVSDSWFNYKFYNKDNTQTKITNAYNNDVTRDKSGFFKDSPFISHEEYIEQMKQTDLYISLALGGLSYLDDKNKNSSPFQFEQ